MFIQLSVYIQPKKASIDAHPPKKNKSDSCSARIDFLDKTFEILRWQQSTNDSHGEEFFILSIQHDDDNDNYDKP